MMHREMRGLSRFSGAVIVCVLFSCGGGKPEAKKSSTPQPLDVVDYKHGAKLTVQYDSDKKTTDVLHSIPGRGYSHTAPPLKPDVITSGQTVRGKHTFELHDNVSFEGRKPATAPTNTCLSITHAIASRKEWHFPPQAKLTIVADGVKLDVPVYSQKELTKDLPEDTEYYEVLITKPTFDTYTKMASAKDVSVQIGTASFKLDTASIASYRDFIAYLTPSPAK
jgi:hypothetical protein